VQGGGYRLAVRIQPKGVRILTRGGHDWAHRFPARRPGSACPPPSLTVKQSCWTTKDARTSTCCRTRLEAGREAELGFVSPYGFRPHVSRRPRPHEDGTIDAPTPPRQLDTGRQQKALFASLRKLATMEKRCFRPLATTALRASSLSGSTAPIVPAALATGSRSSASSPTAS